MALETLSGQGLSLGTTSHSALAQRRLGLGLLWVWVRLGSGAPVCFLCHPLLRPHLLAVVSKLWHRNHHGAKPLNPQYSAEAGRAPEASRTPEARTAWHSPVRRTPGKLPHPGGGEAKSSRKLFSHGWEVWSPKSRWAGLAPSPSMASPWLPVAPVPLGDPWLINVSLWSRLCLHAAFSVPICVHGSLFL